jgi:hypothetical protein
MRTRRLHARLNVFVPTYQWYGYSYINMFVDDAALKNARVSWLFCRGRHLSKWVASHKNGGFIAMVR